MLTLLFCTLSIMIISFITIQLEMLRVSKEVRIFPLLTLMLQRSQHLDRVMQEFSDLDTQCQL